MCMIKFIIPEQQTQCWKEVGTHWNAIQDLMETKESILGLKLSVSALEVRNNWQLTANYIQCGDADIPRTSRLCTTILGVVIHVSPTCRTDAGSGLPPLNGLGAWRSNLPSVNGRRSCFFCRWCKGLERPAMMWCDISFVAGGVHEHAQDVLVPLQLWNCLTLNDTFFPQ